MTSFSIGKVMGANIRIHPSFLILLVLASLPGVLSRDMQDAGIALAMLLTVFAMVVLHEFGHLLAARRLGLETGDIHLSLIGGAAIIKSRFERPRDELIVAIAGPLVNIVLAGIFLGLHETTDRLSNVTDLIFKINLLLACFNLLPIFPMDGGRILRAALRFSLSRYAATCVSASVTLIASFPLIYYSLMAGNLILPVIFAFMLLAAAHEFFVAHMERKSINGRTDLVRA